MNITMRICILVIILVISSDNYGVCGESRVGPQVVKREERKTVVEVVDGEISEAEIGDGIKGPYHVQFFTLQPNALFLPVLLHSHMLLFVHSGRGRLSWTDDDSLKMGAMHRGDLFRLEPGSIFYVHSSPSLIGERLSFFAFFSYTDKDLYEPSLGAYSRLSGMISDFDAKILQSAFRLTPQAAAEIANAMDPPAIVNAPDVKAVVTPFLRAVVASRQPFSYPDANGSKQKKHSPYNVFSTEPDFASCYGWTLSVKDKKVQSVRDSNVGIFMVNMTKGSMMAPHWNPKATEVLVVLHGEGMIRVSCSGIAKDTGCKSMRFKVREGDVFSIPKFHPMAQIAFNYNQLALIGFSKMDIKNNPPAEFVAGKKSVLKNLEGSVLAKTLNVGYATAHQLLGSEDQSVLLECTSCAEAEEVKMEAEAQKERDEEPWKEREEYPEPEEMKPWKEREEYPEPEEMKPWKETEEYPEPEEMKPWKEREEYPEPEEMKPWKETEEYPEPEEIKPWKETEEEPGKEREGEEEKEKEEIEPEEREEKEAEGEPEAYSQEGEEYPEESEQGGEMEGDGGEREGRRNMHKQDGQWSKFLKYAHARWSMGSKYHP